MLSWMAASSLSTGLNPSPAPMRAMEAMVEPLQGEEDTVMMGLVGCLLVGGTVIGTGTGMNASSVAVLAIGPVIALVRMLEEAVEVEDTPLHRLGIAAEVSAVVHGKTGLVDQIGLVLTASLMIGTLSKPVGCSPFI